MPRNGSGSYSLPEAAFVPNTPISSAAVNSDFSDIGTALTGSLARDGQGGMTAVLPLANLGFTYFNDPNTGMRRSAADTQAIFCNGTDIVSFTSTVMNVTGTFQINGVAMFPLATANIADNAVTFAKIADVGASRLLGNPTGGAVDVSEISLGTGLEFSGTSIKAVSVTPTIQRFPSGSGTYTTPANVKWIRIIVVGGGGGGGQGGNLAPGANGTASTFSGGTLSAGGGIGGSSASSGGDGGAATNGNVLSIRGGGGAGSNGATNGPGGCGGNSYLGGGGAGSSGGTVAGGNAATNSGSGGGGGALTGASQGGAAGGGSGAYIEHIIGAPAASYTYAVGPGGAGSAGGGAGGGVGGTGAAGIIIVEEHY